MTRALALLTALLCLSTSAPADAQTPRPARQAGVTRSAPRAGTSRRARPVPTPLLAVVVEPEARAFHARVHVDTTEVVLEHAYADARLLAFEVDVPGARRPVRCAYPGAPSRLEDTHRVARPAINGPVLDVVVDLRVYCPARAVDALAAGARARAAYGMAGRGRARAVAVPLLDPRAAGRGVRVVSPDFRFVPPAAEAPGEPPTLALRMPATDVSSTRAGVTLRLEASREARVYVRPDQFGFAVRRPDGRTVECRGAERPTTPIRDFFVRVAPGRPLVSSLDLTRVCPAATFDAPGIYDVLPYVRLPHDGGNVGLVAQTGVVRGALSYLRVRPGRDVDPARLVRTGS